MAATTWPAQRTYTGRAFDTCAAPPLSAMKAWHGNGFYGAAAVHTGGSNRGCAQPSLTVRGGCTITVDRDAWDGPVTITG